MGSLDSDEVISKPFYYYFRNKIINILLKNMGERKILNKYFPPDFDPTNLPKGKRTLDNYMKVRMMMAMTVQCEVCREFISKGTKFNMRKEDVLGEKFLGLQIFRFYFKCPRCNS